MRPLDQAYASSLVALGLVVSLLCLASTAAGADNSPLTQTAEDRATAARFEDPRVRAAMVSVYLEALRTDEALQKRSQAEQAAEARYFDRWKQAKADDLEFNRRLYVSQLYYSALIFFLVVCVVGAGLWFSWLQFTLDRHAAQAAIALAREARELAPDDPLRAQLIGRMESQSQRSTQSFEAGPIKMTSNVIGLIVLSMSLAFFYLYIDRVYTIRPLEAGQAAKPAKSNLPMDTAEPKSDSPASR